MKNKFLSVLLVSILACQSSYAIDESINNAPYHADSMSCFLEQTTTIDGSASMLRDYGIDNNGKHKYEVSFSGGKSNGFYFNVIGKIDGNAKRCNDLVATNDFVPSKVSGASGAVLWKLTSTAKRGCYPEYYDVVDADSNVKKFDSTPMPEIQVQLDPSSSADGIKKLIITSAFSKSIKVTGFSNSKGKKEESVVFEGPATIDAGNPSVSVDLNTLLCKPEKGNYGGSYRFNIDYKVDGMEKTTQIVISYSCDLELRKIKDRLQTEIAALTKLLSDCQAKLNEIKNILNHSAAEENALIKQIGQYELDLANLRKKNDVEVDDVVAEASNAVDGTKAITAELDVSILQLKAAVKNHDFNSILPSVESLEGNITKLESENATVRGYKDATGKSGWTRFHFYDGSFFTKKKAELETLKRNIVAIQLLCDLSKPEEEFSKITASTYSATKWQNILAFDTRLDQILTNAKNSMKDLGILTDVGSNEVLDSEVFAEGVPKKAKSQSKASIFSLFTSFESLRKIVGISTDVDNNEELNSEVSAEGSSDEVQKQFKADILAFKQLIGKAKGCKASFEANENVTSKVQTALSTFAKDANFLALKTALVTAATGEASSYNGKIDKLKTTYGTLDKSFVAVNFEELVKGKVDIVSKIIDNINGWDLDANEAERRIKAHDFDASDGKKSVSDILTTLDTARELLSTNVWNDIDALIGTEGIYPRLTLVTKFYPKKYRVECLRNDLKALQGISAAGAEIFRKELSSVKRLAEKNVNAVVANGDMPILQSRIKNLKVNALKALGIPSNKELSATNSPFKQEVSEFDKLSDNVERVKSKFDSYIVAQEDYKNDIASMNEALGKFNFSNAKKIAKKIIEEDKRYKGEYWADTELSIDKLPDIIGVEVKDNIIKKMKCVDALITSKNDFDNKKKNNSTYQLNPSEESGVRGNLKELGLCAGSLGWWCDSAETAFGKIK